jgi:hypothetical protein
MIMPLDGNGTIYALHDEKGHTIGTGTREVCEILLYIINRAGSPMPPPRVSSQSQRPNVRAAISI